MFEIEKSFTFEAGHTLRHHLGACSKPHGHSYEVTITLQKKELHQEGSKKNMVEDFATISEAAKSMLETYLDHCWLNDTLQTDSPTAEFIAKWIFDHLESKLEGLKAVKVKETAKSSACYSR